MNNNCERLLTAEGEEQLGHIFPSERIPLTQQTPITANLIGLGDKELVFLVDWERLTELQQSLVLCYMAEKFDVSVDIIQSDIASRKYFPIQWKYLIESYDMRYIM